MDVQVSDCYPFVVTVNLKEPLTNQSNNKPLFSRPLRLFLVAVLPSKYPDQLPLLSIQSNRLHFPIKPETIQRLEIHLRHKAHSLRYSHSNDILTMNFHYLFISILLFIFDALVFVVVKQWLPNLLKLQKIGFKNHNHFVFKQQKRTLTLNQKNLNTISVPRCDIFSPHKFHTLVLIQMTSYVWKIVFLPRQKSFLPRPKPMIFSLQQLFMQCLYTFDGISVRVLIFYFFICSYAHFDLLLRDNYFILVNRYVCWRILGCRRRVNRTTVPRSWNSIQRAYSSYRSHCQTDGNKTWMSWYFLSLIRTTTRHNKRINSLRLHSNSKFHIVFVWSSSVWGGIWFRSNVWISLQSFLLYGLLPSIPQPQNRWR